jgi:hypothetical protein
MTIIHSATATQIRNNAKRAEFTPSLRLSDAEIENNLHEDIDSPPQDETLLIQYYENMRQKTTHPNSRAA